MSCSELSYSSLRNNHLYRDQETREQQDRRRNILHLIENYLESENLRETLCCLQQEARLLSEQYKLCDNVDLECIVKDYEDYYYMRFNKLPKLTKKIDTPVDYRKPNTNNGVLKRALARVKSAPPYKQTTLPDKPPIEEVQFANIVITPVTAQHSVSPPPAPVRNFEPARDLPEEWKPFVDTISQEIFTRDVHTRWSDVIGLDMAKKLLMEAIVYPIRYPELFKGLLSPWKGILLHGPPGK
uniref:Katanin p60 ATPase-containing subunit A-like 2 n=1 Tax=Cacopsylla melanoneura TaxID=428564 RepID=A0A8D9F3U0_9HEMI